MMWIQYAFLVMLTGVITAKTPGNLDSEYRVNNEYIVTIDVPKGTNKEAYVANIMEKIKAFSQEVSVEQPYIFGEVAFLHVHCFSEEIMSQVNDHPEVRMVGANLKQPALSQNCQYENTGALLWGLSRIASRTPPDYSTAQYGFTTSDVGITAAYIFDTGINFAHDDFGGRALHGYTVKSLTPEGDEDRNGHGTQCAGIIMGTTVGVDKTAKAFSVKIVGQSGYVVTNNIIEGIYQVYTHFINSVNQYGPTYKAVASMSLGVSKNHDLETAVRELITAGLTVVAAAGNSNIDACAISPAGMPDVITVGATTKSDGLWIDSNWGSCVDILAPGHNIRTTGHLSPTAKVVVSGTSFAAPHVAGVILRAMSQAGFRPTPAVVRNWLIQTSTKDAINLRGTPTANNFLYAPCPLPAAQGEQKE